MPRTTPRIAARIAAGIAAALATLAAGAGIALALPPGGASPDTKGTSASVSPKTLAAGERITFTVRGFPAGETIYVKIDDGKNCADTSQGGCVYHQQAIPSSGVVTGSLTLPDSIKPGQHWLRFLASEQIFNADGSFKGIKGFTRKGGGEFTIVAGSGTGSGSGTVDAPATGATTAPAQPGQTTGTQADPVAPVGESSASIGPIEIEASDEPGAAAIDPSVGADDAVEDAPVAAAPMAATTAVRAAPAADDTFPIIGTIVLAAAVALSAFALGLVAARAGRAR